VVGLYAPSSCPHLLRLRVLTALAKPGATVTSIRSQPPHSLPLAAPDIRLASHNRTDKILGKPYDLTIFNTSPILATDDTPTLAPNLKDRLCAHPGKTRTPPPSLALSSCKVRLRPHPSTTVTYITVGQEAMLVQARTRILAFGSLMNVLMRATFERRRFVMLLVGQLPTRRKMNLGGAPSTRLR
jgi:hypothetical protein